MEAPPAPSTQADCGGIRRIRKENLLASWIEGGCMRMRPTIEDAFPSYAHRTSSTTSHTCTCVCHRPCSCTTPMKWRRSVPNARATATITSWLCISFRTHCISRHHDALCTVRGASWCCGCTSNAAGNPSARARLRCERRILLLLTFICTAFVLHPCPCT